MEAQGGDAVSLAVLLQAQLLLVEVHGGGVDSRSLQVQADPLPPQPPASSAAASPLPFPWQPGTGRLQHRQQRASRTYLNSPRDSLSSASGKARVYRTGRHR